MRKCVPLPPMILTEEDMELLETDPHKFLAKHPERIVLDMEKTEDGSYVARELGLR